jgi:glucosyl-dolichyl phosphate glucuronosyltransferase
MANERDVGGSARPWIALPTHEPLKLLSPNRMVAEASGTPQASVIVCTHNKSASLRRSIGSILDCAGGADLYGVIVVDNASTDDTRGVVHELMQQRPDGALRYVYEARIGLHYARHAGARAARSNLLLYTDDDVEVDREWVKAYVDAFSNHPDMAAAGGPALPSWETEPPLWLRELVATDLQDRRMCSELSLIDLSDTFTPDSGTFFGLNMAIRYDSLKGFGGFQPELFGNQRLGAGEWGLYWVMRRAGAAIGYVPAARVLHRIPASRMRPEYFERWAWFGPAGEMFDRWRRRPRTLRSFVGDLRRILASYWRPWLRYAHTRRRPDARAVRTRSRAQSGLCELVYLWWIVSRPELREFLDAETYWS